MRTFSIGPDRFLLDGAPITLRCAEIHSARVPSDYWRHRLRMARAMGLNAVSTYVFWNFIEREEGAFDWTGQADVARFCRIAQEEGLWVLLRPGPYVCAEWDMGGLPWWLLRHEDIQLRSRDPRFLSAARNYLNEVGRVLAPLQITRGGPIVMVQVENEYGFFGDDADYMEAMRQATVDAGFDVPLFSCNPVHKVREGRYPGLFPTVNFGGNPGEAFAALRESLPQGPLMCGEFYAGWFSKWGEANARRDAHAWLANLESILAADHSFTLYMAHGGTTFGLWSGADRPFKPDTSSYDYGAPIEEAGRPRDSFFVIRSMIEKHAGEILPEPPAAADKIVIAPFTLEECAPLFANLPSPLTAAQPKTMEACGQAQGCILYRTTLAAGRAGPLRIGAAHDLALVFLDGAPVGRMDRRRGDPSVMIPERQQPARLDILVEAMGRVNFGKEIHDRKGLHGPVTLAGEAVADWQIFSLPLDGDMLSRLQFSPGGVEGPAFWRGAFTVEKPGDAFLDLTHWRKGVVWVNGHCLGRFWNIGPTQTCYLPGCWLRAGANDIVVFDLFGPEKPIVAGVAEPILDRLRPELDHGMRGGDDRRLCLNAADQAHEGRFPPGPEAQTIRFTQVARGRYFCLQSLSSFGGKPFAAVSDIDILDETGAPLSRAPWKIAYVDSEEMMRENGAAENAISGQTARFWHTEWSANRPDHPHSIVIDLGETRAVSGFGYVPRQGNGSGRICDYRIYVGDGLLG